VSEARKIQVRFEELAAGFLLPLLRGGDVRVGRPLSPGMLESFALSRPADTDVDATIIELLCAEAAALAPVRSVPWPDRGAMAITMACHDIAIVTDPALGRWLARGSRSKVLQWIDWLIEAAGHPITRGEALVRHAVLSRFLSLERPDTVASNWGFTHRYLGRPVPDGFFARPRFVEMRSSRRALVELVKELDEEVGTWRRLATLIERSPVTQLLWTELVPDLRLGTAALAVLSDDLLRAGIARSLAAQGSRVATPLGRALRVLAEQRPPPSMLYYVLALIYEVHVIAIFDGKPLAHSDTPEAALFTAVLPALLGAPDDLGALLELDSDDLGMLRRQAPIHDRTAGPEASRYAVALIDFAAPPRLDHEREPVGSRPEVRS